MGKDRESFRERQRIADAKVIRLTIIMVVLAAYVGIFLKIVILR